MEELKKLSIEWISCKEAERVATDARRKVEDKILSMASLAQDGEGVSTMRAEEIEIKITQRLSRKIDADMVQDLAAEHGLADHLGSLFRWSPALNKKQWDSAAENIRTALAPAITVKPGRPSFAITNTTKE